MNYEEAVNLFISGKRLLALCTFPLGASGAAEVLDVAAAHQVAVALRNGTWEVIETPELTRAKSELQQLNEALGQQVTEQTTQLATAKAELRMLSRRLVDVRESERRRFARELHDEMGGDLTGLKLVLERRGRDPRALEQAQAMVNELIARIRSISFDIHPAELDELGLLAALLSHFDRYTAQTNIRVHFEHAGIKRRLSPEIETATYRIVQECLTNVARHARVRGVAVRVRVDGRILRLQVEDWGEGFDREAVAPVGGLQGMRERAELLGGSLRVESTPGRGTRVTAELPLDRGVERRPRPGRDEA